jgi:hypothetical protein
MVGPNNRGNGSRTPTGLPNLGRGLTIPRYFEDGGYIDNQYAQGGLVKGQEYDMSEEQIQDLINKGYKIQYV